MGNGFNVPEICRFYGIVIKMFWQDHQPPHFHAEYQGDEAVIGVETLAVIGGRLPGRALGLTVEWASARKEELILQWEKARNLEPLDRIEPLP